MDARELIDEVIRLAKEVAPLVPILGQGAAIAEKITTIFDDLAEDATVGQQDEMREERKTLAFAVTMKARAEAAALRGE